MRILLSRVALVPIAAIVLVLGLSGRHSTSGTVRFTVDGREQIAAFAQHIQARLRVWPGAHEGGYWRAHLATYLAFYVQSCR